MARIDAAARKRVSSFAIEAGRTPGKRLALPNARVLLHQPYAQSGYSQASDI